MSRFKLLFIVFVGFFSGWVSANENVVPQELRSLIWPGSKFVGRLDEGSSDEAIKSRVAGIMPDGSGDIHIPVGSYRYSFDVVLDPSIKRPGDDYPMMVTLFRHYDAEIIRTGGRRLSILVREPAIWTDVSTRIFMYEVPGPQGRFRLGLWIQSEGQEVFLFRFADVPNREALKAKELRSRIESVGHAPLYIQFDTNKSDLKPDGVESVRVVTEVLKQDPKLKLSIEGHTDNVGQAADNLKLSQARAEAVRQAVIAQGIEAGRLTAVGRGQGAPVADNGTEPGRAKNRRVELVQQR